MWASLSAMALMEAAIIYTMSKSTVSVGITYGAEVVTAGPFSTSTSACGGSRQ